jgi:hypothetical protein
VQYNWVNPDQPRFIQRSLVPYNGELGLWFTAAIPTFPATTVQCTLTLSKQLELAVIREENRPVWAHMIVRKKTRNDDNSNK